MLRVGDLDKAIAFYEKVRPPLFGWRPHCSRKQKRARSICPLSQRHGAPPLPVSNRSRSPSEAPHRGPLSMNSRCLMPDWCRLELKALLAWYCALQAYGMKLQRRRDNPEYKVPTHAP